MTTFSDQVSQYGGAPVGNNRFAGMWAGRVLFVDGSSGSNGNSGTKPGSAFATIAGAVAQASRDTTIYIRPLAAGSYYTESVVAPTTLLGLSIIGTGNGKGGSVYQACTWRNSSNTVDDSALDLRPAHANVENVHFFSRAAQSSGFGIKAYWNTGGGLNIGSSIVNCGFSSDLADNPAAAGVVQSAIRFDSTEGQLVEDCFFIDCRVGVAAGSTVNAFKEIVVKDCLFNGLAANIAADLMLADGTNMSIVGNQFLHAVPAHAAGTMTKYIFVVGGATVTGGVSGNYQGAAAVIFGTNNTASSLIAAGNFGLGGPWTS